MNWHGTHIFSQPLYTHFAVFGEEDCSIGKRDRALELMNGSRSVAGKDVVDVVGYHFDLRETKVSRSM